MVGFMAYYKNGYTNGRVTFSHVPYNYGGGFSGSTGIFTCPVSGLYVVSMTIQVESDAHILCQLHTNGRYTGIRVDINGKGQEPATQTAILRLNHGDTLYITGSQCVLPSLSDETLFSAGLIQSS